MNERLKRIADILDDKKAEHIEVFDLNDTDYFVDGAVIATQQAPKHALMLVEEIRKILKPLGEEILHIDESDEWTIIDMADITVHIMSEASRAKYDLEGLLKTFEERKAAR
ncbi:MAG: ribosome silencing factor [Pseudomonadota bacterium]|jgi:ribosome silencing factor RsfS/YbeB/iojap